MLTFPSQNVRRQKSGPGSKKKKAIPKGGDSKKGLKVFKKSGKKEKRTKGAFKSSPSPSPLPTCITCNNSQGNSPNPLVTYHQDGSQSYSWSTPQKIAGACSVFVLLIVIGLFFLFCVIPSHLQSYWNEDIIFIKEIGVIQEFQDDATTVVDTEQDDEEEL